MADELQVTSNNGRTLVKSDMRDLAKLCSKDVDITSALSDHTVDNMKAFLVAYSRSQLNRVVTLTNSLSKLEDQLIKQVISKDDIDPELIMAVIRTIQKSLDSAISLIKQVTTDESYLQVIINNTKLVQNNINQMNIASQNNCPILDNQDSRDKVRGALNTIFAKLSEMDGGASDVIMAEDIQEES